MVKVFAAAAWAARKGWAEPAERKPRILRFRRGHLSSATNSAILTGPISCRRDIRPDA